MKEARLPRNQVVLLGVGHTNAHIVRMWRMKPIPDTGLTCISDFPVATYSGMLPAVLAGQVPTEQMQIDLVRLCASVGARLILNPVVGIADNRRELLFSDRPPIPFDVLSVGIGSVPTVGEVDVEGDALLKIKPMQTFLARLANRLQEIGSRRDPKNSAQPLRVIVVGSGVAGIEISFCITPFLRSHGLHDTRLHLVTRSEQVLPEVADGTRRRVVSELLRRGHQVTTGRAVKRVTATEVFLDDGSSLTADLVVWATGANSPSALQHLGLPLDDRGFIATDHSLQSTSGEPVFAVGDTGTIVDEQLPKAGVYAVRQGPILWENIQRTLNGNGLKKYSPQRSFLKLINLGDGRAIGEWKQRSFVGSWVYWLKDQIDSKFMQKHQPVSMLDESQPMQCRGCGCKLGAPTLSGALEPQLKESLMPPDDAAEVGVDGDSKLIASTDFFTSPLDDAFLSGRIVAIHSASDILASGARVTDALANVVLPEGEPASQQRFLADFLTGARTEFARYGTRIVGGHTIVGPRFEAGFTVIGSKLTDDMFRKSSLQERDQLYLTKPVGIGVLLAAHMRSACSAADYQGLLKAMLDTQQELVQIGVEFGLRACTDITGFGLAGHLLEMLDASSLGATIHLERLPVLAGALQAVSKGIESSLIVDNFAADQRVATENSLRKLPKYRLLFDPQTCGGLLFGVPKPIEESFRTRVIQALGCSPTNIGEVVSTFDPRRPLSVVEN